MLCPLCGGYGEQTCFNCNGEGTVTPPAPACMGHKRSIRQSELTIFTRCATEAEAQLKTETS